MRVTNEVSRSAAVALLTAALVTGCLSDGSCSSAARYGGAPGLSVGSIFGVTAASASCAAGIEFQGRFYVAWSAKLPVARGDVLGDAIYPPCADEGDRCSADDPERGRPTQVWAMRGVDPDRVVVGRLEGTDRFVIYGRPHVDPQDYFRFVRGTWHITNSRHETDSSTP